MTHTAHTPEDGLQHHTAASHACRLPPLTPPCSQAVRLYIVQFTYGTLHACTEYSCEYLVCSTRTRRTAAYHALHRIVLLYRSEVRAASPSFSFRLQRHKNEGTRRMPCHAVYTTVQPTNRTMHYSFACSCSADSCFLAPPAPRTSDLTSMVSHGSGTYCLSTGCARLAKRNAVVCRRMMICRPHPPCVELLLAGISEGADQGSDRTGCMMVSPSAGLRGSGMVCLGDG